MRDMAVGSEHHRLIGEAVNDTAVLYVRPWTDNDPAEIAAQYGAGRDVAARPDLHVADQDGLIVNEGIVGDDWTLTFIFIERHV